MVGRCVNKFSLSACDSFCTANCCAPESEPVFYDEALTANVPTNVFENYDYDYDTMKHVETR